MQLEFIDWLIVAAFFVVALSIGAVASRQAGKSASEFFLSGRNMPWWLLGFSMVATTFAADTPLLVTGLVRKNGVSGNWVWWAFLLTGMLTVFVYAKLWRRSGLLTDVEFYELRYSGQAAGFLRGFRAIYLGVFFNIITMAIVTLAAIKIGAIMLGFSPIQTVLVASLVTVCFSAMGGLRGVMLTDCLLFVVAMVGSVGAAIVAVNHPDVGGLSQMLAHENVHDKLRLIPEFDFSTEKSRNNLAAILIVPLVVQWWSAWYPGAEPGGGGYIAQRMLAAKNERHATGATLFFNVAHYALRPWPWIIVALASLIVYPDVESLGKAFPNVPADKVNHDLAYPAMLTFLPAGLRGLVVASLIAAYMSTISTQLNWGSSYIANDFWKRFIKPDADEKELVRIGRASTVVMMVLAAGLALMLQDAVQGFEILLQVGAGTGLLFILRWFWWRINPFSELTAMVVSFLVAVGFFVHDKMVENGFEMWQQFVIGVAVTTFCWITVTLVTRPEDDETLRNFCRSVRPGGGGWRRVLDKAAAEGVSLEGAGTASGAPVGIACMIIGCIGVYSALFATGYWLYSKPVYAIPLTGLAIICALAIQRLWNSVHADSE